VGFYVSGQLLTEDYYAFNKLVKGLIGTNNIDSNSRLCMSSAVAGYKLTLGADAPPACYDDVNHAQCLFIAGSNTAFAHPVLFRRIEDAKQANPALKIIVADPRRTDTAGMADLYLPLQPGTDVMLFHGMLHIMLWEGWTDAAFIAAHTSGFDGLKAIVRDCTPRARGADLRHRQGGSVDRRTLVCRHGWPFPPARPTLKPVLPGPEPVQQRHGQERRADQPAPGHRADRQARRRPVLADRPAQRHGRPRGRRHGQPAQRPPRPGQPRAPRRSRRAVGGIKRSREARQDRVEMFQAAADGEIKALWIACTNPAQSMPDQATVRRALQRAEFVVVQEAFATAATCDFADLLLPATTWGEKEGTVTNSERRISRVRAAVAPPRAAGSADAPRHDWQIAVDFARRLERLLSAGPAPVAGPFDVAQDRPGPALPVKGLFPYSTPESLWNEHRESTRGRDLDITGLSYAMLDAAPQQWPLKQGEPAGKVRLYEDGLFPTPDGRARFAAVTYQPVAEPRDARYPFSLTTGRLRDHWHGMTRTGTLGRLFGHVAEPAVQLHASGHGAPGPEGRRPGARHQPARLHRAARAGLQTRWR
jgi:assimilatory nitrate reductase catalytic subunit